MTLRVITLLHWFKSAIFNPHIIYKLRCRIDAGHQQVVTSAGTGDVKQVPFGVVDFFEVRVVGYGFDALLGWDDFIIAGHYGDGTELKAFGEVHGADGNVITGGFHLFIQNGIGNAGLSNGGDTSAQLHIRTDKNADFMRGHTLFDLIADPLSNGLDFIF
jgi:hypothetical protein